MSAYDNPRVKSLVDSTELDRRDARALTRPLSVLPDDPRVEGADDMYVVVSGNSGSEYLVDAREGRCECPDSTQRDPDGGCYHVRRVRYETGERAIPSWVDPDALDPLFGEHVDATPVLAATDGGMIESADADETDEPDDDRPDDCGCWEDMDPEAPPCWPCWRAGFETPNPNPTEGDE